ncbi:hypothetical protein [Saccharopolyspora shandongensis]|uniref:hypothetical protein n=1 Tax=Saccharopolyspora shandongensis TaxID=418495 RepID=UPI0015A60C23|nr:hypothetical protein [Saccharopolyspora shandongensis]
MVATVENPGNLLSAVDECAPDVAAVDVRMPPTWRRRGRGGFGRVAEFMEALH